MDFFSKLLHCQKHNLPVSLDSPDNPFLIAIDSYVPPAAIQEVACNYQRPASMFLLALYKVIRWITRVTIIQQLPERRHTIRFISIIISSSYVCKVHFPTRFDCASSWSWRAPRATVGRTAMLGLKLHHWLNKSATFWRDIPKEDKF